MQYCGIDLANETSAICIIDDQEIVHEAACPTDLDGLRVALRGHDHVRCVIEACPLAESVAVQLESLGHEVVVIDPRKAKGVITTKKKTDKLDARNLAKMAATGWYTAVHRKSTDARLLRSYLRARATVVGSRNGHVQQLRGILRAHGIKVGHVKRSQFAERVRELVRLRCPELEVVVEPLLDLVDQLRRTEAQMTRLIKGLASQDQVCRLLMTIPGVGHLTACAFVATIDDPRRFRRSDQVAAYVGLVPSVHQSGEVDRRGRITKEGDQLMRTLLTESAHVLMARCRRSTPLKRWGRGLVERKGYGKARVAVARKLAMLMHRLWITGEPYDPHHQPLTI